MASTFRPVQAFDYAKRYLKNMPLEQVQVQVLDDVNKMMWMFAPWRWTINTFPNIPIINNTQDYNITVPSDFLYIQDSYITNQQGDVPRTLHIEPWLPPGGKFGTQLSRMALVSGTPGNPGVVRFSPQPGNVPANWEAITLYKKQAPKLLASNINTPGIQVFDDEWFWVYVSGVLYFAYLFGDDQRAGSGQVDPSSGKATFTGQRGVFEANMQIMKQREKLPGMDTAQPEQKEST